MKRKSLSAVGALHPMLFFAGVYIVALFFSIFICSTIFYTLNSSSNSEIESKVERTSELSSKSITVASVIR